MTASDTLLEQLKQAQARLQRARAALAPKPKGGEWEELHAAHDGLLELERAVALERGEECALPCPGVPQWDIGAPLPHVLSNGITTYLVYRVRVPDPAWDGSYATAIDPADARPSLIALLTFPRCTSVKLGAPNDEVISGHPLYGRGLRAYGAHLVRNSRWIAELQRNNAVHPQYRPESWSKENHYLFCFHDEVFECIDSAFQVEQLTTTYADVVAQASSRMLAPSR